MSSLFRIIALPTVFISLTTVLFQSCSNTPEVEDEWIRIHSKEKLQSLNPLNISDAFSSFIAMHIYQPLLAIDFETNELVGVIAKERPTISRKDNLLRIEYNLRDSIYFGKNSLTAKDVVFSLKLNVCPYINPFYASYYDFIDSVIINPEESNKLTIYGHGNYPLNEYASGDYFILSQELLDPDLILDNYSISYLKKLNTDSMDTSLKKFLDEFKESSFIDIEVIGSGAYNAKVYNENLRLRLSKKDDWWADNVDENSFLIANPKKLEFLTVKDDATSLNALKAGDFDIFPSLKADDYNNLEKSKSFNQSYQISSIDRNAYFYIGFNQKDELLSNKNLRKLIAFAINVEDIIKNLEYGFASPLNAPFETEANKELNSYSYNKDSISFYLNKFREDRQEIDKEYNISYSYNAENKIRESIGLILKQNLKELGINIELKAFEWSVYLQKLKEGSIELFINGASTSSLPPDFYSSYHSESANTGRNYANFSNPRADSLIQRINSNLDDSSRVNDINKFQRLINDELPYYFLYKPRRIVCFSNKLENAKSYNQRPNYWPPMLYRK